MGGSGGMGNGGSGITDEMMALLTDMYIRRADTSRNSITCQFNIYDPFNYIGSARFLLWKTSENITDINEVIDAEGIISLAASAADTELTFHDLDPNEDYTIVLGFVNEDGVFEERDRITASTRSYTSTVEITTVREGSYDYVLHLDPEMDDIKTVTMSFNGTPENWVNNLEFEVMMSERGFVGTYDFEDGSMPTLDKLQIDVTVEFEGNSVPITVARTTVENPFFSERGGASGVSAASLNELMEEVSTLRKQIAVLSEEMGLEEEVAGQDTRDKTGINVQDKNEQSGSQSGNQSNGQSGSQSAAGTRPSGDGQNSAVIQTPEESKSGTDSDTKTEPSKEAPSDTADRPSAKPEESDETDETASKENGTDINSNTESTGREETKAQADKSGTEGTKAQTDKTGTEGTKVQADKPDAEGTKVQTDKPDTEGTKAQTTEPEKTKVQIVVPKETETKAEAKTKAEDQGAAKTEAGAGATLRLKEAFRSEVSAFSADVVREEDKNAGPQSAETEAKPGAEDTGETGAAE